MAHLPDVDRVRTLAVEVVRLPKHPPGVELAERHQVSGVLAFISEVTAPLVAPGEHGVVVLPDRGYDPGAFPRIAELLADVLEEHRLVCPPE